MTVLVAGAHAHVQRLVSVVKMATVLEGYTTEEHGNVVFFCGQKNSVTKEVHKEMFPAYGRRICSEKRFNLIGKHFADDDDFET
jgi:hypothetical protein